jgi:hypothetical protein
LNELGEPRLPFRLGQIGLKKGISSFLACAGIEHRVIVADWTVALLLAGVLLYTKYHEDAHLGDFWKIKKA